MLLSTVISVLSYLVRKWNAPVELTTPVGIQIKVV